MKVKFNRKRLVAALRKSKAEALEMFRKNTRQYHVAYDRAKERYKENVRYELKDIARNSYDSSSAYDLQKRLFRGCNWPTKPQPPRLEAVDILVQQLELSDDEVVLCDTKEEYIQLTRACAVLGTCRIK